MTIKPVDTPGQKRGNSVDNENKETIGQVVAEQNPHESRNQSPRRDSFEDLARTRRRSPHKNSRSKRRDHIDQHVPLHLKRDRNDRENLPNNITTPPTASVGLPAPLSGSMSPLLNIGNNSPAHTSSSIASHSTTSTNDNLPGLSSLAENSTPNDEASTNLSTAVEEKYSGYNSGDEHFQSKDGATAEEWQERDDKFAKCMHDHGYVLKNVEEDGACLFRAISLQIYGDEEMHDVIRQHTMDYIFKNREYFTHFVTEDINSYIKRKRRKDSHGNHIEIQAMSEIYNRPVEVYCYKPTPINIFNSEQMNNGYAPLRLSYQRGSHYNAILDPYNATVGVGLGLAGYVPELQTKEAVRLSEELAIEQTMFEDKLRSTDWEATNEAIEEQIARESYLQWCRDNLQRTRGSSSKVTATITAPTATVTSSQAAAAKSQNEPQAAPSKYSTPQHNNKCPSTITKATAEIQTTSSSASSASSSSASSSSASASASVGLNSILNNMNTTTQAGSGGSSIPMSTMPLSSSSSSSSSTSPTATSSLVNKNNTDKKTLAAAQPMDFSVNLNLKTDGSSHQNDLGGYASDETDISSVSSSGYSGGSSNSSPTSSYSDSLKKRKKRSKKLKNVSPNENVSCSNRKRRCDSDITSLVLNSDKLLNKSSIQNNSNPNTTTTSNNKPNTDSSSRSRSPDIEQRPSTSKQCCSKVLDKKISDNKTEKTCNNNVGDDGNSTPLCPSTSAANTKSSTKDNENSSTFYQELLEASYAADGMGQLSESEMLQKAIQMSTQDYIEDQKRRYLFGP